MKCRYSCEMKLVGGEERKKGANLCDRDEGLSGLLSGGHSRMNIACRYYPYSPDALLNHDCEAQLEHQVRELLRSSKTASSTHFISLRQGCRSGYSFCIDAKLDISTSILPRRFIKKNRGVRRDSYTNIRIQFVISSPSNYLSKLLPTVEVCCRKRFEPDQTLGRHPTESSVTSGSSRTPFPFRSATMLLRCT
eukprot:749908-Hanusia_phi.AAC.3